MMHARTSKRCTELGRCVCVIAYIAQLVWLAEVSSASYAIVSIDVIVELNNVERDERNRTISALSLSSISCTLEISVILGSKV